MRIKHAIFIGVVAALASLTAPALARNSDARNSDGKSSDVEQTNEPSASSSCSALQQTPDGTWTRYRVRKWVPHSKASANPRRGIRIIKRGKQAWPESNAT